MKKLSKKDYNDYIVIAKKYKKQKQLFINRIQYILETILQKDKKYLCWTFPDGTEEDVGTFKISDGFVDVSTYKVKNGYMSRFECIATVKEGEIDLCTTLPARWLFTDFKEELKKALKDNNNNG